ncbi:MAG: UDP-N-acetylenolpyruvoylglucosamine reductase, partial [Chitinophagaceae bacterium]
MQVHENYPLKSLNTFGLPASARYFAAVRSIGELQELLAAYRTGPKLILGGGSNVLLTKDVDGLVVKNEIMGITKTGEDEDVVY